MADVKRFVVERSRWLRGDPDNSQLLNREGRMCCLGFVAEQRGVPRGAIAGARSPAGLMHQGEHAPIRFLVNKRAGVSANANSQLAYSAMRINDSSEIDDAERERRLSELFAQHGFEMVFV